MLERIHLVHYTHESTLAFQPLQTLSHNLYAICIHLRVSEFTGLDYWTGLLEWTTGLTFHLKLDTLLPLNWAVIITGSYSGFQLSCP